MAKRRRQDSLRISWLDRNSSNGIGLFLVQIPPGERKSGMPHSVEIRAPVNGTMTRASSMSSRRAVTAVVMSGAIMLCPDPGGFPSHIVDRRRQELESKKQRYEKRETRGHHEIPAHNAARAQSRCRDALLLRPARPEGSAPPRRREEQV